MKTVVSKSVVVSILYIWLFSSIWICWCKKKFSSADFFKRKQLISKEIPHAKNNNATVVFADMILACVYVCALDYHINLELTLFDMEN